MTAARLPIEEACTHCGYVHHKRSGDLKYYIGAMQCPRYVDLLLEEQDSWGARGRAPVRGDMTETRLYVCGAPNSFLCVHKGSPDHKGRPACMSPDGYPSGVPQHEKLVPIKVPHAPLDYDAPYGDHETWDIDGSKLCPHRSTARRKRVEKSGDGTKKSAKKSKGNSKSDGNRMPGAGNWRKELVYTELQRRIDHLVSRGVRATPEAIARLGGFTERRAANG